MGDELASIVVDQVLDEFADEKMQQHVNRYFGDYVKSTGLRFEMLANDGVEKCVEPIVELTVEGIIDEFCSYDDLTGVDGPELVPPEVLLREPFVVGAGGRACLRTCSRSRSGTTSGRRTRRSFRGRVEDGWAATACARSWRGLIENAGTAGASELRQFENGRAAPWPDRRPRLIGMLFPRSVFELEAVEQYKRVQAAGGRSPPGTTPSPRTLAPVAAADTRGDLGGPDAMRRVVSGSKQPSMSWRHSLVLVRARPRLPPRDARSPSRP